MDFFAELDRITRAYKNPLLEIIQRDYAQMPEYVEPRAVEHYDELARKRAERLANEDARIDGRRE